MCLCFPGTTAYTIQSAGHNQIGLTDYLGEGNNRSDIFLYLSQFRAEASAAAYNFSVEAIANASNQQTQLNSTQLQARQDEEGNLDAEVILGITWPTPLTAYATGGSPDFIPDDLTPTDTNEPYLAGCNIS
jgi:tripeptidyl-peptidase-1